MEKDIYQKNEDLVSLLKPKTLWKHFATLCEIPRPSTGEEKIADFIVDLALKKDFGVFHDELNNVLVQVPASDGYEHLPTLCLQSHLDIVCEKNADVEEMFPIELILKDLSTLTANGTTLGADNGIGVAAMMALISDNTINHGPLELLFTTIEETGLVGAESFEYDRLESKRVLNLDSETEGELYVGCAGGVRINSSLEAILADPKGKNVKYNIELSGFAGGHSGVEIHLGRGNAIKVLASKLSYLREYGIQLVSFAGGGSMNAIPREAKATIMVQEDNVENFTAAFKQLSAGLGNEYINENPQLVLKQVECSGSEKVFELQSQEIFLQLLHDLPHGVISMEPEDGAMVRTSNNIGIVTMDGNTIEIGNMYRSSSQADLDSLGQKITALLCAADAENKVSSQFPPWEPRFDATLLKVVKAKYEEMFGNEPEVKTMHAGLECIWFYQRMPHDVEIVSFGPTMGDVHSPKEWVDVASVKRFWDFLLALLLAV